MNIHVHIIPHKKQRYDTCGDWFYTPDNTLHIKVSQCSDARFERLIAVHEIIEATLCDEAGIDEADVDAWDLKWHGDGEPGDDPNTPYHKQHVFASMVERDLARELGVDWEAYEKELYEFEY